MDIKLSNEPIDMGEIERKPLLPIGAHKVKIVDYELAQTQTGTPQIIVQAENEHGETRSYWYISPKALPYTINRLKQIIIANKETDDEKAKVLDYFEKVNSQKALWDTIQKAVIAKGLELKCWAKVYTDEYDGRRVFRTDLLTYKPEVEEEKQIETLDNADQEVDLTEIPF